MFRGSQKTPNTLTSTSNVVLSLSTHSSIVPYATGDVGTLTVLQKASLGIDHTETFVIGIVGGGVKRYAPNSCGELG